MTVLRWSRSQTPGVRSPFWRTAFMRTAIAMTYARSSRIVHLRMTRSFARRTPELAPMHAASLTPQPLTSALSKQARQAVNARARR